jgi:dUTP pyrophosphatase
MDFKNNQNTIKYVISDERAVLPNKAHPSDIGYDLTVIDVYKKISNRITLFETGVAVSPPPGYYIEIVPRSSMSKTGYMLANSVGTIDPDYTGTLKIALIKVDTDMDDIELPFTRCQMILRKAEYSHLECVESLTNTKRGDGGFGSTDKKIVK